MSPQAHSSIDHSVQSDYSSPGRHAELFDVTPPTIDGVSALARNLVVHYRASGSVLPEHSKQDISLRWVEDILTTDQQRHSDALDAERPKTERVQGCCRDHSLIAVSALRHHGLAARSRVGFASYFPPTNWYHDHVIVEVWMDDRWRRFDPEIETAYQDLPDPTDIEHGPDSPFLTSAHAWLGHRAGSLDVNRFGVDEGLGIGGDWFVHSYVIAELAHRFSDELLLWDVWGAMSEDLAKAPPAEITLVDEIAELLVAADDGDLDAESELLDRYRQDPRLHPGQRIHSISPTGGTCVVDLVEHTSEKASS